VTVRTPGVIRIESLIRPPLMLRHSRPSQATFNDTMTLENLRRPRRWQPQRSMQGSPHAAPVSRRGRGDAEEELAAGRRSQWQPQKPMARRAAAPAGTIFYGKGMRDALVGIKSR